MRISARDRLNFFLDSDEGTSYSKNLHQKILKFKDSKNIKIECRLLKKQQMKKML